MKIPDYTRVHGRLAFVHTANPVGNTTRNRSQALEISRMLPGWRVALLEVGTGDIKEVPAISTGHIRRDMEFVPPERRLPILSTQPSQL